MQGHRIGYIRVSTFEQNPQRQLEQVQVDRVFIDKASGKDVRRPQLSELMEFIREGDTVVVHSMDRLARNLDDLRGIVQGLVKRGICVEFVKEHLTFTGEDSPMATLIRCQQKWSNRCCHGRWMISSRPSRATAITSRT